MTSDGQERVEKIFARATEKGPSRERAAYLDGACGGDAALRDRLDELLAAHDRAGDFLGSPAVDLESGRVSSAPPGEQPGDLIGPYKLLQLIGEGGFGAVYMVEQQEPVRRRVALKIIKLGMDTRQVVARFEAERQALAMLDHPNIAKVLDAGATPAGRPYFVMELVKGISFGEYCDKANLPTRDRLALFVKVCRAVHHAHQKGLIHRDLKPSNVLVTLHDGTPVPKVIDFGIARATNRRLTEKTLFTEYGQFIGTPVYMSPEQAEMSGLDIDTRSDIYSLGVMLYETLTGTTPLDAETLRAAGYGEMQRVIREDEPPVPSSRVSTLGDQLAVVARHRKSEPGALSRLLRGDLDWIVMKALEKDRARRYESASELVADIERFLKREPVMAGPPSVIYKLRKFVQRHRVGVLAGALVSLALVAGLALATAGFVQARKEASRSQTIADFLQDLLVSTNPTEARARDMDVASIVATAREVFGDDHATVAATLESRALQVQSAGRFAAAELLFRESLRIWKEVYGEEHVRVAITYGYLGRCLELDGKHREAEAAFRHSIALTANLPENEGVHISETRYALASLLMNRGEYAEAEQLLRESLAALETYSPDEHFLIAIHANLLVNILVLQSKDEAACVAAHQCVAAWRRALPGGGVTIGRVASQLGYFLHTQGHDDDAEPLLVEALEIFRETDEPPMGERHIALRAMFRIMMDRKDESEDFVRIGHEYIASAETRVGATNVGYLELLVVFAERLVELGRLTEALPLGIAAVRTLHETGAHAELLTDSVHGLGSAAWDVAASEGTDRDAYERALEAAEIVQIADPDSFCVVGTIAVLHQRLGMHAAARDGLRRLRALVQGPDYAPDDEMTARLQKAERLIGAESEPPDGDASED